MTEQDEKDHSADSGNSGAELAAQLEAARTTERGSIDGQLADLRKSLAEKIGVTVSTEPTNLGAGQKASLAERNFGNPDDVITKAHRAIEESRTGLSAFKSRLDIESTRTLAGERAERGKVVTLLADADPLMARSDARSAFAEMNRAQALDAAFNLLGGRSEGARDTVSARALQNATIESYASPEGGAPIIDQRTIELSNGTIVEINVHGAGSDEILDSQVAVIRK